MGDLIGESQGGYKREILAALTEKFPMHEAGELADLAVRLDTLNTVTACSFCNSTTSRTKAPVSMRDVIAAGPGDVGGLVDAVTEALKAALRQKREDVAWKLTSVREAYESFIAPRLSEARTETAEGITSAG